MEINKVFENSYKFKITISEEGKELGYIDAVFLEGAGEVYYIEVLPECRKQGLGSRLLAEAIESSPRGEWSLEVRSGNEAAKALYKKFGFEAVGLRKNYYKDPVEDGILMVRK